MIQILARGRGGVVRGWGEVWIPGLISLQGRILDSNLLVGLMRGALAYVPGNVGGFPLRLIPTLVF